MRVAELIRGDRIQRLEKNVLLEADDILLIRGDLNRILELHCEHEVSITEDSGDRDDTVKRVEMMLFELMVAPESTPPRPHLPTDRSATRARCIRFCLTTSRAPSPARHLRPRFARSILER